MTIQETMYAYSVRQQAAPVQNTLWYPDSGPGLHPEYTYKVEVKLYGAEITGTITVQVSPKQ